jgi:hypothetical protein
MNSNRQVEAQAEKSNYSNIVNSEFPKSPLWSFLIHTKFRNNGPVEEELLHPNQQPLQYLNSPPLRNGGVRFSPQPELPDHNQNFPESRPYSCYQPGIPPQHGDFDQSVLTRSLLLESKLKATRFSIPDFIMEKHRRRHQVLQQARKLLNAEICFQLKDGQSERHSFRYTNQYHPDKWSNACRLNKTMLKMITP